MATTAKDALKERWLRLNAKAREQGADTLGEHDYNFWQKHKPDFANHLTQAMSAVDAAEALTNTRQSTHGDWKTQAETAQELKKIIHKNPGQTPMNPMQIEAVEMICVKLSRIICGNPYEPDHWDDIAGYAVLGKGGHKS